MSRPLSAARDRGRADALSWATRLCRSFTTDAGSDAAGSRTRHREHVGVERVAEELRTHGQVDERGPAGSRSSRARQVSDERVAPLMERTPRAVSARVGRGSRASARRS